MNRREVLQALATRQPVDLAVIGGGATGLGVALDAALRGFSVVLLESHDFAGGTSSRSTKLLHGGVRYLAQGNVALVREALAERATVLRIAPHLAQPLPFVMPAYQWWQAPFYGAGLKLYDLMAGRDGLGRTEFLNAEQTLNALPGLRAEGLKGGVKYWDGQFDDARLALALARAAQAAGATVLNYAEVTGLRMADSSESGVGCAEIEVSDRLGSAQWVLKARCVVNATGVWVDQLRNKARGAAPNATHGPKPSQLVSPSQGVHLVVDREFMPGQHALLVPKTSDGRVLFAVPWLGKLVLGTTDTPRQDVVREPEAFAEELQFILREASKVLTRPLTLEDVRSMWVGLRPLVAPPERQEGGTKTVSREHTILVDSGGLLTVTGGKWTTYRAMAEDVLHRCFDAGLLPPRPSAHTEHHRLFGAPADGSAYMPIHEAPGLHLYGTEQSHVAACPGQANHLGMGLSEAMVRYAVRHELAHTVEDVLARRSRVLFLDASAAAEMAPRVQEIMASEGVMAPDLPGFLALCCHYLPK